MAQERRRNPAVGGGENRSHLSELLLDLIEFAGETLGVAAVQVVGDDLERAVNLLKVGGVAPDLDLGEELLQALEELMESPGRLEAAGEVDVASMQDDDVGRAHGIQEAREGL